MHYSKIVVYTTISVKHKQLALHIENILHYYLITNTPLHQPSAAKTNRWLQSVH